MALFGTSGIRDLCPSKVSPRLALLLGSIFCEKGNLLVVGYDGRPSGIMLKSALSSGAMQSGASVLDIGVCATPTLSLYCQKKKCLGAMITASHNPPEYNGIKLFESGCELERKKEAEIEKKLEKALAGKYKKPIQADWNLAGSIEDKMQEAQSIHSALLMSNIDVQVILSKRPKVALDCANMAGCALMPQALRLAGCEVEKLNCTLGEPYGREFEPNERTLSSLCQTVKEKGCDLGIAHDGDADRAIIVDEKGKVMGLDVQLALVCKSIFSDSSNKKQSPKGSHVVSTVESSLSLRELVSSHFAKLEITPVGSLSVARKMREKNAVFGGEPCGEYIFKNGVPSPDGLFAGLYFVQMFCKYGKLSLLCEKIPPYPMHRAKISCSNEKKEKAMKEIAKRWPFSSPSKFDGLRTDGKDWWVLVRPSGTEPYIRITAEAKGRKTLEEKVGEIDNIVKKACK